MNSRMLLGLLAGPALLQGTPAQQEALTLAFPDCTFVRKEFYPTPAQVAQLEALASCRE